MLQLPVYGISSASNKPFVEIIQTDTIGQSVYSYYKFLPTFRFISRSIIRAYEKIFNKTYITERIVNCNVRSIHNSQIDKIRISKKLTYPN